MGLNALYLLPWTFSVLHGYWVLPTRLIWASLVAQLEKNPPAMRETWIPSLGWEDPLEKGKGTHPSILTWRIPMDRGAWQATAHGVVKSQARLSD